MIKQQTKSYLEMFSELGAKIPSAEKIDDWGWMIRGNPNKTGRPIDITFLALTHGNEVAGLSILNEIMRLLEAGYPLPPLNIAFLLGNPDAAREDKRQLESDLNRSFGIENTDSLEARRCKKLEVIFKDTDMLIDIHQTQGPTAQPFLISKFDPLSYQFCRTLLPSCPMVTYWAASFNKNGLTTVNYQLAEGGHGFAIELGEKGYDPSQIEYGTGLGLKAIGLYKAFTASNHQKSDSRLFTFQKTIVSKTGEYELVPGLSNFSEVPENFTLGEVDGEIIKTDKSGAVLFPKYGKPLQQLAAGYDVCRVLRPVTEKELADALEK